jgi:acetyl esterase/lipase
MKMTANDHALHAGAYAIEPLWPDGAPGQQNALDNEAIVNRDADRNALGLNRAVSGISRPSLTAYLPPEETATGTTVLVLPGGGFHHLAIDKEGYDVAKWLNTLGVAGIVVKYRTEAEDRKSVISAAIQDTKRAMRIVRRRSKEWRIDPDKIGLLGFSAGGYLAASVAADWDKGRADASDPVEQVSCRSAFLGLIYAVTPEDIGARIKTHAVPAFLAHAGDDQIPVENSLRVYHALHQAGVPAELHLYAAGGHGFGLGVHGGPVASWTERFAEWLEQIEKTKK